MEIPPPKNSTWKAMLCGKSDSGSSGSSESAEKGMGMGMDMDGGER